MGNGASTERTRASLLIRLRDAADAEAWSTFHEVYVPLIYRFCRARGLQDSDAADVSQEVLVRVVKDIRSFDYRPEKGRFRDWLGAITRARMARFFKKSLRRREETGRDDDGYGGDEPQSPAVSALWDDEFNSHVLRMALDRARPHFEPATWRLFERAWIEHHAAADVAAELGVPIQAVYVAKSRVLKRLREEVLLLAEDLPVGLSPMRERQ
jgi:RNA polymerase sigma-70 factor (ECF subfamily)